MEAKKQLGFRIVERYHSTAAAEAALQEFNTRFSKRDLAQAELPEFSPSQPGIDLVSLAAEAFSQCFSVSKSRSDLRRLIEQGSVQVQGEKVADPKAVPALARGDVLRLDKKHAVRIR